MLSWRHSGISVDASQRAAAGEEARLERLARYATRVPLAAGAVRDRQDGKVESGGLVHITESAKRGTGDADEDGLETQIQGPALAREQISPTRTS